MECVVCVQPFTSKRNKIHCNCGLDVCINCAKRYILDRLELPHCMSCKNRWTKQFLYDNFKPSFVNGEYRKARKKILLDNELAKLPITQEYLEAERAFEFLDKNFTWDNWNKYKITYDTNIAHSWMIYKKTQDGNSYQKKMVSKIITIYKVLYNSNRNNKDIEKIFRNINHEMITYKNVKMKKYYRSFFYIKYKIDRYRNMWKEFKKGERYTEEDDNINDTGPSKNKSKFIHKCPDKDCKGFVSSAYKCGLCNKFTCSKCLEIKDDTQDAEHICNEDSIKSAEIIKKNTKACPKCGTRIFKINGCDQMWCTSCNTAFNWATGAIYASKANFHNPHYIEWVTQNNGNVNHNEVNNIINCGELPNLRVIFRRYSKCIDPSINSYHTNKSYLKNIYALTSHIIDITIQKLRDKTIIREEKNTDLRIRYMKNEITKKHLAKIARMRDNVIEKNVAMIQILEIFTDTMINQFNNIMRLPKKDVMNAVNTLIDTAFKIRVYCNEQLANISKNYKMKVYQISEDFNVGESLLKMETLHQAVHFH